MSFLNLRRLLPPRKVWKIFTNKLQIKLRKLNSSKAIEKPKMQLYKTSKKISWPPFLSIQPKKFKLKPKHNTLIHLNKITPPVYVDRLFVDSVSTVKERMGSPLAALVKEANDKKSCSSGTLKRRDFHPKNYRLKTRKEAATVTSDHKSDEADNMWESITSPQTQGINERAEEFIARFRAQMHHQEMLARRL